MMPKIKYFGLDSAEERAAKYPDTFWIPSEKTRQEVKAGFFVKLIFRSTGENNVSVERMWVEVKSRRKGKYKGVLKSSPAFLKDLIPGEDVEFGPEHICEVSPPTKEG